MTGNEYQLQASRTINGELTKHQILEHSLYGMVSEVGEIHGIYQKLYQGHTLDLVHVKKELGDLMWFIGEFCSVNGLSLDDVMYTNIEKLKARYPEGFEADKSINRKEGDI